MRERYGRSVTGAFTVPVLLAVAGCSLLQRPEPPVLTPGQRPVLTAENLDALGLSAVPGVFPPGATVTVERLDLPPRPDDSFLGGRYVFSGPTSITVRLYGEERDLLAALNQHLRGPLTGFQLGTSPPNSGFPLVWWYHDGPPATIVYTYGNALVTLRLADLDPARIPDRGLAAARDIALRIQRVAAGKPATGE